MSLKVFTSSYFIVKLALIRFALHFVPQHSDYLLTFGKHCMRAHTEGREFSMLTSTWRLAFSIQLRATYKEYPGL